MTILIFIWILEKVTSINKQTPEKNLSKNKSIMYFWEVVLWLIHYTPFLPIFAGLSSFGIFNIFKVFLKIPEYDLFKDIDNNLRIILFILLLDFFAYLSHFLLHKSRLLFKFHSFHHSASNFNIVTVHRVHFFEVAFIKIFQTFALVLLGGNIQIFWIYHIFSSFIGHIKHSNFKFNYPGFFKYLIQSPAHHWVHHSDNPKHYDKNFGDVFQIWDVLFKPNYDPTPQELKTINLGLKGIDYIKYNLMNLFLYPYKNENSI